MTTVVRLSRPAPTVVRLQVVEEIVRVVSVTPNVVRIVGVEQAGPRGPQGETGATGPPGEDGADAAGGSYTHIQNATSDTWVIPHGLGYPPAITIIDSGGTTIIGDITHDSVYQSTARFASAFSGRAYAS